jgi:hypothetical protein
MRQHRLTSTGPAFLFLFLLFSSFACFAQLATIQSGSNLRKAPNTNSAVLETLKQGDTVTLTSTRKRSGYYHVQASDGTPGWVWSKNLLIGATPPAGNAGGNVPPNSSTGIPGQLAAGSVKAVPQALVINGQIVCGPTGDASDAKRKALNGNKNRADIPDASSYIPVDWNVLAQLPSAAPEQLQGAPVEVEGYLSHKVNVEGAESTNCHLTNPDEVDWHMYTAVQLPSGLTGNNRDGTPANSFFHGGGPSASAAWNLDFWGLYRRQTEAARAEMLASIWGQRAAQTTLIQTVAEAYFQLRSLDAQLEVTNSTIAARQDSLHLTQVLEKGGAAYLEDVRQAEELLHSAQANLPEIRRQIAVQENTLSIILGHNPGPIDRGLAIGEQAHPQEVSVGIPSELLERRPDIQEAEEKLDAANARIGVARAQYFPQISLTSLGGAASNQLNSIFTGPSSYWFAAGSITQPIFSGGRIEGLKQLG